jgi:pyruvate dehydrogenase E2 component (dihydrolipoamide acetyltransferase)
MSHIVRLPKLGLSDRGEIVEWAVSPGETVSEDEQLAVLESDKSAVDITAPVNGVFLGTYVDVGEEIEINPGRPIAAIGASGEELPDPTEADNEETDTAQESAETARPSGPSPAETELRVTPRARVLAEEEGVDPKAVTPTGPEGSVTASDIEQFLEESEPSVGTAVDGSDDEGTADTAGGQTEQKVTPKARRRAREEGIDLATVTGTGPQNAITEADLDRAAETQGPTSVVEQRSTPDNGGSFTIESVRERSQLEQTMAENMSRSIREKPHARGTRMVNIERLGQLVEELSADEQSLTMNDLLLQAVVATLQEHPRFNAVYTDGEHRLVEEVNLGYAVDTEAGLIVPVIHGADQLGLSEFVSRRHTVVERALDGTYDPADLQNGTFTVTNVGALGLDSSYSVINPPQVAILAIGRRQPALFEEDDDVVTATGVELSLLIDHRVLDGGDAGRFLQTLTTYIEEPGRLLRARTEW